MMNNEKMYHIGLSREDICGAKYAILPGDPFRVDKIASKLSNCKFLNFSREYKSCIGDIEGEKILVISTGMGGPSTAICVEELAKLGVINLIRVGTCGGMQLNVMPGDIIIAQAAIRQEGTSKEYVPIEFPAVANFELVCALKSACVSLKCKHHLGVVQCKDSFYGQHDPERMPVANELLSKWDAWIKAGCLASEMETASLYTVSQVLGLRSAAVLLAVWNQEREKKGYQQDTNFDTDKEIDVALTAIAKMVKNN